MAHSRKTASLLLVLGAACSPFLANSSAAQTVVLDQPLPTGGPQLIANPPPSPISDSGCGPGTVRSFADDFVVSAPVDVNVATWTGSYVALAAPASATPFSIVFHQDSAGLPGPTIATRNVTPTQTLVFSGFILTQPRSIYTFAANFSPVHLDPGTYWVEIFETEGSSQLCFSWTDGDLDATRGRDGDAYSDAAPGTTWNAILRPTDHLDNRAITLRSQPAVVAIPTLGQFGLAALASGVLLAGLRRLRRKDRRD